MIDELHAQTMAHLQRSGDLAALGKAALELADALGERTHLGVMLREGASIREGEEARALNKLVACESAFAAALATASRSDEERLSESRRRLGIQPAEANEPDEALAFLAQLEEAHAVVESWPRWRIDADLLIQACASLPAEDRQRYLDDLNDLNDLDKSGDEPADAES